MSPACVLTSVARHRRCNIFHLALLKTHLLTQHCLSAVIHHTGFELLMEPASVTRPLSMIHSLSPSVRRPLLSPFLLSSTAAQHSPPLPRWWMDKVLDSLKRPQSTPEHLTGPLAVMQSLRNIQSMIVSKSPVALRRGGGGAVRSFEKKGREGRCFLEVIGNYLSIHSLAEDSDQ